jgi:hypothetical protein
MKLWYTSKTLWANVLGIAAFLLQSQVGFLIPAEYQAAGLGAVNLGLRAITGQPLSFKAPVNPTGMLLVGCLLMSGMAMQGCAALDVVKEKPVITELAVRLAVGRVLDNNPDWVEPALRISSGAIRTLDADGTVGLAALEEYVVGEIRWDQLLVEEEELLRLLIQAIRSEIEATLRDQGITAPEEVAVQVATVFGWIYQSAEMRFNRS